MNINIPFTHDENNNSQTPPKTTVPLKLLQYVNALCVCMQNEKQL